MTALRCSFCNRTVDEVGRIISGPNPASTVRICNECVEVCVGILHDRTGEVDVPKGFKQRRPLDSGSLSFIVPVLILMGVGYCVWGYYEGGVPELEEKFAVWLTASASRPSAWSLAAKTEASQQGDWRKIAITLNELWTQSDCLVPSSKL